MTSDHAKAIADYFANLFDQECAHTLKVLRAVPDNRRDYKPDEKSRTSSNSTIASPKRIQRLRSTPGEQLEKQVDFFDVTKGPSIWFLGLANNHSVHHRGQLMTYLRAMGSKVPSLYGGSADEPFQGA